MGCINASTTIRVKSIRSFKKEITKNIIQNESEELSSNVFNFLNYTFEDSDILNSEDEQSKILINAQVENNELIFL